MGPGRKPRRPVFLRRGSINLFLLVKVPFVAKEVCADQPISSLDGTVSSVSATAQAVQLLCVFSLVAEFEVSNHYENTPMQ